MRKWKLRGALAAGLVAVFAATALAQRPSPSRVSWENLKRIRFGMHRAEVETILGGPPTYRADDGRFEAWEENRQQIMVRLDADGHVRLASFVGPIPPPGPLEQAQDWVECQWRRWFPEK
jgi:hypothetical protein